MINLHTASSFLTKTIKEGDEISGNYVSKEGKYIAVKGIVSRIEKGYRGPNVYYIFYLTNGQRAETSKSR
jgi:hypothetical protein